MYIGPLEFAYSPQGEHSISRQQSMALPPGIDVLGYIVDAVGGTSDFIGNYSDMRNANIINGDKYFTVKRIVKQHSVVRAEKMHPSASVMVANGLTRILKAIHRQLLSRTKLQITMVEIKVLQTLMVTAVKFVHRTVPTDYHHSIRV